MRDHAYDTILLVFCTPQEPTVMFSTIKNRFFILTSARAFILTTTLNISVLLLWKSCQPYTQGPSGSRNPPIRKRRAAWLLAYGEMKLVRTAIGN